MIILCPEHIDVLNANANKVLAIDRNPSTGRKLSSALRGKLLKYFEMLTRIAVSDCYDYDSNKYRETIECRPGDVRYSWEVLVHYAQEWFDNPKINRATLARYTEILESVGLLNVDHDKLRQGRTTIAPSAYLQEMGRQTTLKVIRLNLMPIVEDEAREAVEAMLMYQQAEDAVAELLEDLDQPVEQLMAVEQPAYENATCLKKPVFETLEKIETQYIYNNTSITGVGSSSPSIATSHVPASQIFSTANESPWLVGASRSVKHERVLMPRDQVPDEVDGEFYATWVSERDGLYHTPWVIWDIDGPPEQVDQTLVSTRDFVRLLQDEGAAEEALRVIFSTRKGFHVYLDSRSIELQPSKQLHEHLREFCLGLLPNSDPSFYSRTRVVGVPNSRHRDTKLYYVPIPLEHLDSWDVTDMRMYAQRPREFDARAEIIERVPNLYDRWLRIVAKPRPERGFMVRPMRAIIEKTERGLCYFDGVDKGMRDQAMYELAAWCRRKQLPIRMAWLIVSDANVRNRPPLGERELKQKINSAYKTTEEQL